MGAYARGPRLPGATSTEALFSVGGEGTPWEEAPWAGLRCGPPEAGPAWLREACTVSGPVAWVSSTSGAGGWGNGEFHRSPWRLSPPTVPVPSRLSMELDYGRGMVFRHQASDLIPEHPCSGVSLLPLSSPT